MPKEILSTDLEQAIRDEYTSLMEERKAILLPSFEPSLTQSGQYQFEVDGIHYQQKGIRRLVESLKERLGIVLELGMEDHEYDKLEDLRERIQFPQRLHVRNPNRVKI